MPRETLRDGGGAHGMMPSLTARPIKRPRICRPRSGRRWPYFALWEELTPLGRNEFICWVEDAKQPATRQRRIQRTREELLEGKKRPCCWAGCIHRTDKAPSKWQQPVLIDKKPRL